MNVQEFLTSKGVPFKVRTHPEAFDSQHLAQTLHVKGAKIAKVVLLRSDAGSHFVAVLPAPRHVDLDRVSDVVDSGSVHLATEVEISRQCPDCEFGVLSAFGSQYGMQTLVDESLAAQPEIDIPGNTHTETIELKFDDFVRLEHPQIASFSSSDGAPRIPGN